jgi:hypothetical protein
MMQPSPEYLAAPEVSQSREEASSGQRRVVVENYATKIEPGGVSRVYLSTDGGRSFAAVGWSISAIERIKLLVKGRHWPPEECRLNRISDDGIVVNYLDHLDASDAQVFTIKYSFQTGQWRV